MERLTFSKEFKESEELDELKYISPELAKQVYERLAAYEDTGLSPERCAELAKADQEGRLVELPCKVGDELYTIDANLKNQRVNIRSVSYIIYDGVENQLCDDNDEVICSADDIINGTPYCSYFCTYKTFLTLEEAEKALEENK